MIKQRSHIKWKFSSMIMFDYLPPSNGNVRYADEMEDHKDTVWPLE